MLYITPSIARSRAGGLNAGACDVMMSLQEIVCQLAILKIWMHLIEGLYVLGKLSMIVISFRSSDTDFSNMNHFMTSKGLWSRNAWHN
ncbi:unnamed protein product [Sphagnum troendelagicum]|uniref:Uncharacterized protein n=1 Tax=Sphagnum troendelagicum TaxID=128251 RepID=A0ABP0U0Z5_9BRYO